MYWHHVRRTMAVACVLSAVASTAGAQTQSGSATIKGTANTWYAGLGAPAGDGTLPTLISLIAGTSRVLRFSNAAGAIGCCGGIDASFGPEGSLNYGPNQSVSSVGGISGITTYHKLPLTGVFLGATGQPVSPPTPLDFIVGMGENFLTIAPLLGQSFFIGDGFTSSNVQQQFFIPDAATQLYLGVPDACGFSGMPTSCYSDNPSQLTIDYDIVGKPAPDVNIAPEPSSIVLMATGMVGLIGLARKRRHRNA